MELISIHPTPTANQLVCTPNFHIFPKQSYSFYYYNYYYPFISLKPSFYFQKWRKQLTITHSLSHQPSPTVSMGSEPVNVDAPLAVKANVGKLMAEVLRYYYFDSDSLVEEAAGEDSSGRSLRERDEDGFRESETEVLKQLSSLGRLVVSAGNGAVQSVTNLALLRHGISIWIDVPLDIIAKESMRDELSTNPDSFSEALDQLTGLFEENRNGYSTADATISLQSVASKLAYDEYEQVTAEDMALEVLTQIEKLTRLKKMMEEAGRPY